MKLRFGKWNSMPASSVHCGPLPSLTPSTSSSHGTEDPSGRVWQTQCDLGKTRSIFHASPCCSSCCGSEKAGDCPHSLPFSAGICAVFKHQPRALCPSEVAHQPPLFPLHGMGLLPISRQTNFESLFSLHVEPPLAYSYSLGLQTFTTMISIGNLHQSSVQKPNDIFLMRKEHGQPMA